MVAALLASACGGGGGDVPDTPPTAEEIAEAEAAPIYFDPALTRPRCPVRVNAEQYPAPDLLGVRLGMTRAEAFGVVFCDDRREFNVETQNTFFNVNTNGETLGPQSIKLSDGARRACTPEERMSFIGDTTCRYNTHVQENITQTINLLTPGLPGQERVMGIWRSQTFTENPPTFEATVASLVQRFGEPGITNDSGGESASYVWGWDTAGTAMTSANPQLQACRNINSTFRNLSWSPDCGLTVVATVRRSSSNAGLAASYSVGMVNQQVLYQVGEAVEQHFTAQRDAAQQQELERAKGASAPEL
jgi:hypothetical protein